MAAVSEEAKLKREARIFGGLATIAVGLTLVCIGSEIVVAASPLWKGGDAHKALINIGLQAVLAAPALFYVAGLRRARQVFRRIGSGELLTLQNSKGLSGVGWCLAAGAVWSLTISEGLEPAQTSQLAVYLDQAAIGARDLTLAALGLGLIMIGRVLAAAVRLKAENDSFV